MHIARFHTLKDTSAAASVPDRTARDEDGLEFSIPKTWGEAAAEVFISRVFCKTSLPAHTRPVAEPAVPQWLWRHEADDDRLQTLPTDMRMVYERDAKQVFIRITHGLAYHGWKAGLFTAEEDARAFVDELGFLLLHQIAAPELPLLAAAGLDWAYGLPASFLPVARILPFSDELLGGKVTTAAVAVAPNTPQKNILRRLRLLADSQSVDAPDRKTAVTLPVENIDSPAFIHLKRQADIDVAAQQIGRSTLDAALHYVMDSCDRESVFGFDPAYNGRLKMAMGDARRAGVTESALRMALSYAQQGYEDIDLARLDEDMPAPPLQTTLSVPDDFIERALTGHGFLLSDAGEAAKHYPAEKLWNGIAAAVWASGEPALFFRDSSAAASPLQDTIADFSPSGEGGLVFLPGTAAPGATVNVQKFTGGGHVLDTERLVHSVKIITAALEASYAFADVPPATLSYRPVNIGVLGLSSVLMGSALPYDSDAGRAVAGLVTALVSGAAQEASGEIAQSSGAFPQYPKFEKSYLQGLKDKMSALAGTSYMQKGVTRRPVQLKSGLSPDPHLADAVRDVWARAYNAGREKGFRHAHLTALGASADMQSLLACPARDIAPLPALVRFEGHFESMESGLYGKKLNPLVPRALSKLGYSAAEIDDINFYAVGHGTLLGAPAINHASLKQKGFHQAALDALEAALGTAQHIRYVFNKWTLGDDFCQHMLGFAAEDLDRGTFDMLRALGFSEDDIDDANLYCCGAMTLEGAPHLLPDNMPVFDGLAPAGTGVRRVSPEAQVKMQAAVEPFLSGCACHTIELSHYAAIEDVQKLLLLGWELGVKRLKLYRDGCSLLHPLALPVESHDDAAGMDAEEEQPFPKSRAAIRS
ncbi:MAG: hypothetical protein PW788_10940 [Micavibrio sp.]|nr:hypothetical protein [Micavibrio sp.]